MNCEEFRNSMPELAAPPAPGAAGDLARRHLDECPACAEWLKRHRTLAAGLGTVAAEWRWVEAPPRLESRLLAAYRAQSDIREMHSGWLPALVWASAVAATVILALLLSHGHRVPERARPLRIHASRTQLAGVQPAPAETTAETEAVAGENGFIPLPNAANLPPSEELDVVRIEVPRSAMIAVGYPVSPDRASEMVQAEVAVGFDGLARAVRFTEAESSN